MASREGHRYDCKSEETGELSFCDLTGERDCPLHYFTWKNRPDKVQEYLKKGEDINCVFKGMTPLHVAVKCDAHGVLDVLLRNKCDVNATELESKKTPLSCAALLGKTNMVCKLVQHGADVNASDNTSHTPFYWACQHGHRDTVMCMLRLGVDVNQRSAGQRTPLIAAAIAGQAAILQMLLRAGCLVDLADASGCTALYHAVLTGDREIVQLLLAAGANPNIGIKSGEYPVHVAALHGNAAILDALITAGCDVNAPMYGGTAMYMAVQRQHYNAVKKLIQAGAELDHQCKRQYTAAPLIEAIRDNAPNLAIIVSLIQGGCNVDLLCHIFNKTPIEQALMKGHQDVAQLLLAADCRPPRPDVLCDILEFHSEDNSAAAIQQILHEGRYVRSLRRLCRSVIRSFIGYGHSYEQHLGQLQLPSALKQFLQFPELTYLCQKLEERETEPTLMEKYKF